MTPAPAAIRRVAAALRRTPFHPQWLLERRRPPASLASARGRLLDIGAADRWLQPHVPPGVQYVALDYPPTGGDLYGARPDVFADAAALPFADASFDRVACLEVLEHVRDPARVAAEVARVLAPGGVAWFSMPFLYPVHDAPHDYQRYTADGLRRDFERAGLRVRTIRRNGRALRTAGLLAALAVAGGLRARPGAWLLLPVAGVLVLAVNCLAWAASFVWPDWDGISAGHDVEASRT